MTLYNNWTYKFTQIIYLSLKVEGVSDFIEIFETFQITLILLINLINWFIIVGSTSGYMGGIIIFIRNIWYRQFNKNAYREFKLNFELKFRLNQFTAGPHKNIHEFHTISYLSVLHCAND